MKRSKVLLDFLKLSIIEKIGFYRNVIAKLTGNISFSTPDVPLLVATSMVDNLQTAFVAAQDGGQTPISQMHDKEEAADSCFRKLALYVERTSDGNESMILSSGFNVSAQPTPRSKSEFSAQRGSNAGIVKLQRKVLTGAKSYIWQYTKDPLPEGEDGWTTAGISTRAIYDVEGLTVACKYWFRVAAITPDGTTDYSNPILFVVS